MDKGELMNIAVIKLRDLIKYACCFIIIVTIIAVVISAMNKKEEFEKQEGIFAKIKNSSFLCLLKMELPILSYEENSVKKENNEKTNAEKMLGIELAMLENLEDEEKEEIENMNNDIKENENESSNEEKLENDEQNKTDEVTGDLKTEVINDNNIKASYTDNSNSVKINNQTEYDLKSILADPSYTITNKQKFVIYHTHTCESYTSSEKYKYEMTGSYRTTDLNYTVSRVADELEKYLKEYGKTVIHDKTYHDYPSYNGSYGRSLKTLENIIDKNKDTEIAIDLHRDAVGSSNTYGPTVKIGDEVCAQVMFVIGTDGSRTLSPQLEEEFTVCN